MSQNDASACLLLNVQYDNLRMMMVGWLEEKTSFSSLKIKMPTLVAGVHWATDPQPACSATAVQVLICLIALSRGGGGIFNFHTTPGVDQMLCKERPSKHLWLSTDRPCGAAAVQSTTEARRSHLHLTATFSLYAQLTFSLRLSRQRAGRRYNTHVRGRSLQKASL